MVPKYKYFRMILIVRKKYEEGSSIIFILFKTNHDFTII